MSPNWQLSADLFTLTEEILIEKFNFLSSNRIRIWFFASHVFMDYLHQLKALLQ